MSQTFKRTVEDFRCGHCGNGVKGNGYTNHCPQCLWSRHVDVHPGDRAEPCRGMMKLIAVTAHRSGYVITHRCTRCGVERRNKTAEDDCIESLLAAVVS